MIKMYRRWTKRARGGEISIYVSIYAATIIERLILFLPA